MEPVEIAYCELYVADQRAAAGQLTSLFGFVPVAEAGPSTGVLDRRSVALLNGAVAIVVTEGGPDSDVAGYVDRHGDSIADIAMTSPDVAASVARVVAAGAEPIRPLVTSDSGTAYAVVPGFGELRHTLLAATAEPAGWLPPDRPWRAVSGGAVAHRFLALDHVAVCLEAGRLRPTVEYYDRAFGLDYYSAEYIEVGGQAMDSTVVRSPSGGVTFTLIEPDPAKEPGQIDQFLTSHAGAGVQHLAFLVEDIVDSVRNLSDRGLSFLETPPTYYDMLVERAPDLKHIVTDLRKTNVLADQDEWGYLRQIFTRSPYPRNTLFYELIQRNEARGFGSANIKALYEAVERARAAVSL